MERCPASILESPNEVAMSGMAEVGAHQAVIIAGFLGASCTWKIEAIWSIT